MYAKDIALSGKKYDMVVNKVKYCMIRIMSSEKPDRGWSII
jgi:hypothetical protein